MQEAARINTGRHHSRCNEGADFGGKEKPIALSCPVKRADAEAIAAQNQAARARVPNRESKLAAKAREHSRPILFPEVRQQLRVATTAQVMTALAKVRAKFVVIEEFAVEDGNDAFVLVGQRLVAVSQANDAQAPRGQRTTRFLPKPLVVGATMSQSLGHRPNGL